MTTVILQGPGLNQTAAESISSEIKGDLNACGNYYKVTNAQNIPTEQLANLRSRVDFDINVLPCDYNPENIRLLITDMDSTFINIECVDEIADFANIKPQVAAITEAAMRGEINFEESLTQRVQLLSGLATEALQRVYDERLRLNPGGETMLDSLHKKGIKIALVSGGFTFFTQRLKERYQLDYTLSNTLEIVDNKLTGKVKGTIVGAEGKAAFLKQLCDELNINTYQVIAMGDGANDLKMMKLAGLSIAYHAKPAVQKQADTALNHCGLEGVIGLL